MKKDICFFYEEYGFSGGVKTYMDALNGFLIEKGYKTDIVSCIDGSNCISLCKMKNIHILLTPYYLLKLILFFKKNNYKIIHCQSLYSLILVNFVKRLLHKDYTIVSTIHIPYARSLFQKILNMFGFKIHANHLIGCCKWALEETIKKNIVKYDDKDFILNWSTNLVNENKVSDGKICFIGHLSYQKNIDLLREIIISNPSYNFKIIGDGGEKHKIEGFKNVEFLGRLCHKDTLSELSKSKVLLLPSRYEALPFVILEALSLGIPVVSSNVGGISELKEFTNMIYICNDKSDYKKCFDEILIYKNMKYWNNITNISFEEQMKKYLEIYNTYR